MVRASGRFELVRSLGEGGMGQVWEARDPRLPGRRVALKRLRRDLLSPDLVVRFLREAEALARVSHPGVLRVHEVGSDAEGPYLVSDLIEGSSLSRVVAAGGLPPARAVPIVLQLCEALTAVHAAGVVHRDVKPDNVLLLPDDRPVLLDFGLARELDRDGLTRTGELMGTPAYMAPEQVQDPRGVDARADVYALGAVLYALLAGRPPFAGSLPQVLLAVLNQGPTWPCTRDLRLDAVVRRAMAIDREQRPPDAVAFAAALLATASPRPRKALGRLLGLGLLLAAGLTWRAWRAEDSPSPAHPPRASRAPVSTTAPDPATSIGWHPRAGQRLSSRLEIKADRTPAPGSLDQPLHYQLRLKLSERIATASRDELVRHLTITGLEISAWMVDLDAAQADSPLRFFLRDPVRVRQDPRTGRVLSVEGLREPLAQTLQLIGPGADLGPELALHPLRENVFAAHLDHVWSPLPAAALRPREPWQTLHKLHYWSDQGLSVVCSSSWDGDALVSATGVSERLLTSEQRSLHGTRLTRTQRWTEFGVAESKTGVETHETWSEGACVIDFQLTYTAQLEPGDRSR